MNLFVVLALILQDQTAEIERLIAALSEESVEARVEAEERLIELGSKALPALRKVAAGAGDETRARAVGAITEIVRLEEERIRDEAEKARLIQANRTKEDEAREKEPGQTVAGGSRFGLWTRPYKGGLVLRTHVADYLRQDAHRWLSLARTRDIAFDVVSVTGGDGKELALERCGRCSPESIYVRDTAGPLRVRAKGKRLWFSAYEIEFPDPKNGDRKKVGHFTIGVEWPKLKVTSRREWPKDVMERVGKDFTFELKPEALFKPSFDVIGGGAGGGGRYGTVRGWCSCPKGPQPVVPGPKPEMVREVYAEHGVGRYRLENVAKINYWFYKPIEAPFDFTVEPEARQP